MPQNQAFDSGELRSLAIGYDKLSTALSPDVRLVDGLNMMVTNKGALNKRPGTTVFANNATQNINCYIDHGVACESLDFSTRRFLCVTTYTSSTATYSIINITPGTAVSGIVSLRSNSISTLPHEMVVSRGSVYIKGFAASHLGDPLQSVVYDAARNFTSFWGILGPTIPTGVTAGVASTYNFTVNVGWQYVYTYKTTTGQESNRSALQTDPSKVASNTGAIANFCPSVGIQGHPDTVNVPTICVYRTTDGGGNFYFLEQITNTGSGTITYVDRNFNDGLAVPSQPYPDSALDTTRISPTLTSNSPPPAVYAQDVAIANLSASVTAAATTITISSTYNSAAVRINGTLIASVPTDYTITIDQEQIIVTTTGSTTLTVTRGANGTVAKAHANSASVRYTPITGIDPPMQCTPIARYSNRLWYGIGNVLFYSGNEEISTGIPEECWPSGLNGNFYRFNYPITNVISTSEGLYIICTEEVHWLKGFTKDSFQVQPIFTDIGGIQGHPRAICAADKSIIFLTNDFRICMARGLKRDFLSDPLASDLKTAITTNLCKIHMERHAYQERDLLVVLATDTATNSPSFANCRQWVYDFNQSDSGLWNVPWDIPATFVLSAYIDIDPTLSGAGLGRWLFFGNFSRTGGLHGSSAYMDFTMSNVNDYDPPNSTTTKSCFFTVSLVRNPTGNHVNMLREPGMTSILHAVKLDRTAFASDTDPTLTYYLDNSTGASGATAGTPEVPPRRIQSTGYTTLWYMIDTVCERVSAKFSKAASAERLEVQMIAFVFNPDFGA